METNRIDLAFALAKSNQAKSASGGNGSGFADMLLGAMGQKAGAMGADKLQIKPAEAYTPRRRFDDYKPYHFDARDDAGGRAERRVDSTPPTARSAVEDAPSAAIRGTQQRAEPAVQHGRPAHAGSCGETQSVDMADVGADSAVDPASDVELTEGDQDTLIDGDNCDNQASGDDTSESETPLIAGAAPAQLVKEMPTAAFALEPVATSAAATQAVAGAGSTNGASPEEIAAAVAALGTAAVLPDDLAASDGLTPATTQGDGDKPAEDEAVRQGVTFAATLALTDTADDGAVQAEGQAQAIAARNEQQLEDAGSTFRRNAATTRRNQGNGAGTTGSQGNPAHHAAATVAATAAEVHANAAAQTTVPVSGIAPIGFDTGLGNATGLPGWNLHLAQGAAVRRGDFVANLRQHLQNLPAHEQVALSIQRSLRDGGGNITLQLSPAELGRIHLKLKIDEENNVQASVVVERPATLELLQRDMKALERALQEAGLKAGPGDLSFSLQGGDPEAFAREFGSGSGNGSNGSGSRSGESADEAPVAMTAPVVDTADGWVDVQV